jgi:hypothetical protein
MSETVSRGGEAGRREDALAAGVAAGEDRRARPPGRRGRAAAVAVVLLAIAAGAGIAWAAWAFGAFRSQNLSGTSQGAPPPATQAVVRENLSSQVPVTATLGYADSYPVRGQGGGTLTWLPSAGQVIGQGQVLYKTDNGSPVVLLYGPVPAWRTLA